MVTRLLAVGTTKLFALLGSGERGHRLFFFAAAAEGTENVVTV